MLQNKTALIIGATGLVGNELVKLLLADDDFKTIKIFARKSSGIKNHKLEEHIVDFESLPAADITGDVIFNCMGTTLKQAGSKEKQAKVDVEYPANFAKLAAKNKVPVAMVVSAPGADEKSFVFYSRLKGQLERQMKALPFDFLRFIHPSVITGDRQIPRAGEKFFAGLINGVSKILPFLKKYRSITGKQVAEALVFYYKNLGEERVKTLVLEELFVEGKKV